MSDDDYDLRQRERDMWGDPPAGVRDSTRPRWTPGGAPMTLEQAANVLVEPDAPAEEWAEAARVANEAREKWGWPESVPTKSLGHEVFICSLCGLDLEEDEVDDGASAHDSCRLDDALKTIEAWSPVVCAAVSLDACYSGHPGWTPQDDGAGDRLAGLLEAVRALQMSDRPIRSLGGQK